MFPFSSGNPLELSRRSFPGSTNEQIETYRKALEAIRALEPYIAPIIAAGALNPENDMVDDLVEVISDNTPSVKATREALAAFCERHHEVLALEGAHTTSGAADSLLTRLSLDYGQIGYLVGLAVGMRIGPHALTGANQ